MPEVVESQFGFHIIQMLDKRGSLYHFRHILLRPVYTIDELTEAAVGGPIALVEEGDIIKINIPELKLELDVSDEELAARKAKWQPREPKVKTGYLARYASMVTSGNRGAILEVPKAK